MSQPGAESQTDDLVKLVRRTLNRVEYVISLISSDREKRAKREETVRKPHREEKKRESRKHKTTKKDDEKKSKKSQHKSKKENRTIQPPTILPAP